MATVITAMSGKGGVGKTTLLCALALELEQDGATVACIDTDPQESFYKFSEQLNEKGKKIAGTTVTNQNDILAIIKQAREQADVVLVDTAGDLSVMTTRAITHSNYVIIPTKPDKNSCRCAVEAHMHIKATEEGIQAAANMDFKIPHGIIFTDVNRRTNAFQGARASVSEFAPVLHTVNSTTGFHELAETLTLRDKSRQEARSLLAVLQMEKIIDFYKAGAA
jgi:chromosome partitioning protein